MRVCVCVCVWMRGCVGLRFCVLACSLAYPASKAHAPCYNVNCGHMALPYIFLHYVISGTILKKNLLIIKYVFRFSLQILSETFLILRNFSENVKTSSCKVPVILVRF